jgi:hypothetical protein
MTLPNTALFAMRSRGHLMVTGVPDIDWELGNVRLRVGARVWDVRLHGVGWAGTERVLELAPLGGPAELEEIMASAESGAYQQFVLDGLTRKLQARSNGKALRPHPVRKRRE